MTSDSSTEDEEERDVPSPRNPDLVAFDDCPDVQDALVWVLGTWRCLKELAQLPHGPDVLRGGTRTVRGKVKKVKGTNKEARLRMLVKRLCGCIGPPRDSLESAALLESYDVLAHTEQAEAAKLGPISAPSLSVAVVWFAQSVLFSLERARPSETIRPVKRIKSIAVEVSMPNLGSEVCPDVIAWIAREIPTNTIEGLYDKLLAEFQDARQIVTGRSLDKHQRRLRKQVQLKTVLGPDEDLNWLAGLILLALYSLEFEGNGSPIVYAIQCKADALLGKKQQRNPAFQRSNVTNRLPGLKALGFTMQPWRGQPSLTSKGREWVRDSGLLAKYPKWKA